MALSCVTINRLTSNPVFSVAAIYSKNERSMSSGEQLVNHEAPRQPTRFEDMSVTDQMVEMEHRRVVRRQRKAAVTRFIGNVERAIIERDRAKVQVNLDKLKQSFVAFETYHDNYHELLDTEELIDESEQWFMNVEQSYIKGVKAALDFLSDSDTNRPSPAASNVNSNVNTSACDTDTSKLLSLLHIPSVSIDTFAGDPADYHTFISAFDETIHTKIDDPQIKLTRLIQHTSGAAKSAIKNCILIGGAGGYDKARDILRNRFGNDHLVAQRVINDIKIGKAVSKAADLQQLADDLEMTQATLDKLGMSSEIDNQRTIIDVLKRCKPYIYNKWKRKALEYKETNDSYPKFSKFVDFMSQVARESNDPVYGAESLYVSKGSNFNVTVSEVSVTASGQQGVSRRPCVVCKQSHGLFACGVFKGKDPRARFEIAKQNRLCFNCLVPGHYANECRKPSLCSVPGCGQKHTKFLHIETRDTGTVSSNESDQPQVTNGLLQCAAMASGTVYLPIVPIKINESSVSVYALLDSGSTNSFISQRLVSQLSLRSNDNATYRMNTLDRSRDVTSRVVSITVSPCNDDATYSLDKVLVTPKIPVRGNMPVNVAHHAHLSDLPIHQIPQNVHVDLLIGMDNAHLIMPHEIRSDMSGQSKLYASRSLLGWSLNGPVDSDLCAEVSVNFISLEEQVENLWKLESQGEELSMSVEDRKVVSVWESNVKRENDHYVLPIPWKDGCPKFPDNRHIAFHRLRCLESRLGKTGLRDKYAENVDKLLTDGYAERVPEHEVSLSDGTVWYIPHHAVTNPAKPEKVRNVYDCSAKVKGVSLNNQTMQGPDLTNKLVNILLRFRQFRYGIMADIEAMYYQVRVPVHDRNALRFLWYNDDELVHYRMAVHVFGGKWCASSTAFALKRTVQDQDVSDLVRQTVLRSFYVDDLLISVKTKTDASEVIEGCKVAVRYGGFNLTKLVVNDPELLSRIPDGDRAKEVRELTSDMHSRALGVRWDVNDDCFYYVMKQVSIHDVVTRRIILSTIATMYDPLGLIAPIALRGKVMFQEATRSHSDWDAPVMNDLAARFDAWVRSLGFLDSLRFQRCVVPEPFIDGISELHVFCDASQGAYGACVFVRSVNASGQIHVSLLTGKGRLAPIKQVSIPRLELAACVEAVKLEVLVRREFDIVLMPSTFWTDSQVALAYISNDTRRFKTFVANRVARIRETSTPGQWHHVPGIINPADILSRGCDVDDVPASWFSGPLFLSQHKSSWPQMSTAEYDLSTDIEVSNATTLVTDVQPVVPGTDDQFPDPVRELASHYSSFYKLSKAVAWLLRLRHYLCSKEMKSGPISMSELNQARRSIVMSVQRSSYSGEMSDIDDRGHVSKSSPIRKLYPVVSDGILVVGGRLLHSALVCKRPPILPRNHPVSRSIVHDCHGAVHLGTEWTLSNIRTKYWIVGARNLIKQVRRCCPVCKRLYAAPLNQRMADLPPERCVAGGPPFEVVGTDLFGPICVKVNRSSVKRWGCIFTCFKSRAVHIEVLNSLEAMLLSMGLYASYQGADVR